MNAWIYLLLDDPEMYIRTTRKGFSPVIGEYVIGRESFSGTVLDSVRDPVKDALVTIYDDSTEQNPDYYAEEDGSFVVNFSTTSLSDNIVICISEPDFEP